LNSPEDIKMAASYWAEQTLLSTAETEIKTISDEAKRATKDEDEYARTVTEV